MSAVVLAGAAVLGSAAVLRVDMAPILTSAVRVEEGAQTAIVLNNLQEEVLSLGTGLRAEQATMTVRFIPLLSELQVSVREGDLFAAVAELMKRHWMAFVTSSKGGQLPAKPVEPEFHARVGAHRVTVVKVNEARGFRAWVTSALPALAESGAAR